MTTNIHSYDLGDLVRVYTSTPFTDVATGDVIDPDAVKVSTKDPAGAVVTYVYGVDNGVIKNDTGDYEMNIDANLSGIWYYRWWSTGDGQAAEEKFFRVREANAVEP